MSEFIPLPDGMSWDEALTRIEATNGPEFAEETCAALFGPRPKTLSPDEDLIARLREALLKTASGNASDRLLEEARVRLAEGSA